MELDDLRTIFYGCGIMGDDEQGLVCLLYLGEAGCQQTLGGVGVKPGGGFVKDEQWGVAGQRESCEQAAALATRKQGTVFVGAFNRIVW